MRSPGKRVERSADTVSPVTFHPPAAADRRSAKYFSSKAPLLHLLLLCSGNCTAGHVFRTKHSFGNNNCTDRTPEFAFAFPNRKRRLLRSESRWAVDSGATKHCCGDKSLFTEFKACFKQLTVADGAQTLIAGIGTVRLRMLDDDGIERSVILKDVLYVPALDTNLVSVRQLWKHNRISTRFKRDCVLKDRDGHKFTLANATGLFDFGAKAFHAAARSAKHAKHNRISFELLHKRLGHCGKNRCRLAPARSIGLPDIDWTGWQDYDCDACNRNANKLPMPTGRAKPKGEESNDTRREHKAYGDRVSSDLIEMPDSFDGFRYALCLYDNGTRWLDIYFLKSKSADEVLRALKLHQSEHASELPPGKIITWHCDNGGEFISTDIDDFCQEICIRRTFSVPYEPSQNAHAERIWGVLLKTMRCLHHDKHLSIKFWTFSMLHARYLHNHLPSSVLPNCISPYEARFGVLPDLSKLRTFGCLVYFRQPDHQLAHKLANRSIPAINLGRDPSRKGYYIWIPDKKRVTTARQLRFNELKSYHKSIDYDVGHVHRHYSDYNRAGHSDFIPSGARGATCGTPGCMFDAFHDGPCSNAIPSNANNPGPPSARLRSGAYQVWVDDFNLTPEFGVIFDDVANTVNLFSDKNIPTPDTYEQAIDSPWKQKWKESMEKEIKDLLSHETWDVVSRSTLPKSGRVAKSKWVYKIKFNRDGTIERFKSRFCICGYSQIQGVNFDRAFSATMRATSFRVLMALSSQLKLRVEHVDVTSAFTQAELDDVDLWCEPPKGFEEYETINGKRVSKVLKLRKALYGAKQSARLWQLTLRKYLLSPGVGLQPCSSDPCLFSYRNGADRMLIGVYVDDILIAHNSQRLFDTFIAGFKKQFRSKHLGRLDYFMGIGVNQSDDYTITLSQSKYILDAFEEFFPAGKSNAVLRDMPFQPSTFDKLTCAQTDTERAKMRDKPYLRLIGKLLYACMSRPDIIFPVGFLCTFMHDPSLDCYAAAQQVLLYLAKTHDHAISYGGEIVVPPTLAKFGNSIRRNYGFHAYSDSSWGKSAHDRFGYVIFLGNGPVAYVSKLLKIVAWSSCEAEYAASAYAVKEINFIRNICSELQCPLQGSLVLAVDNTAAIDVANNLGVTGRTKHFRSSIHYIRDEVMLQRLTIHHVRTDFQLADLFTKALDKTTFLALRKSFVSDPGLG
jgi:hypothetical protein